MARYRSFYGLGHVMTFMEVFSLCKRSYEDLQQGQQLTGTGDTLTVEQAWYSGGYAAFKIRKPGGWTAIVFRGTDGGRDWIFNNIPNALGNAWPPQYITGARTVAQAGQGCILVGHSLGGGIATYASAFHGNPAATIFPAPVIPSRLPRRGRRAEVMNYVCHGEILTELAAGGRSNIFRTVAQDTLDRMISGTVHRRLGEDEWVQSNGGSPIDKHMLDQIVLE